MKKAIVLVGVLSLGLFATDFSQMTMEQLNAMRGSVSTEERDAFRAEIQKRLQSMSQEERQNYSAQRRQGTSNGQGSMQRLRDGSGGGMMHRGGGKGR